MKQLNVALVHDYLGEFGGAERVLLALSDMFPYAPIYTAFFRKGEAYERFKNRDIRVSWAHHIPFFATKLHSPLRFLAPLIWESFDFKGCDLVISSASWYITKGILTGPETVHISYIHTPPRYLYGFETSIDWQKYWPLRVYARVINHFLREYDFAAAQRPDILIANSENTRARIKKFYRRDAKVIYPPVSLIEAPQQHARQSRGLRPRARPPGLRPCEVGQVMASQLRGPGVPAIFPSEKSGPSGYFLVVSRVVGGKGLELAVRACSELGLALKVVGEAAGLPAEKRAMRPAERVEWQVKAGWSSEYKKIKKSAGPTVEFLGFVSDEELVNLYSGAKAFLATARDEDFGMTVVEAQLCGIPVIAYRGGGYLETVVDGKTGIFFDEYSVEGLKKAIKEYGVRSKELKSQEIQKNAKRFSKQKFVQEMKKVISSAIKLRNA